MKVIIGAGNTSQEGWISTQETSLNVLSYGSMATYFKVSKASAMLAEHVWEHFSIEEGIRAARHCFEFLEYGGYMRIAVPDGNLRNDEFLKLVGVGGPGPKDHPAAGHKVLYTYRDLVKVFETAGFVVNLLEYCDDAGSFIYKYWNPDDGKIGRSFRYDTRNSVDGVGMASIIMDAYKPLVLSQPTNNAPLE